MRVVVDGLAVLMIFSIIIVGIIYINFIPGYAGITYFNKGSLIPYDDVIDGQNTTKYKLNGQYDVLNGNSTVFRENSGMPHIHSTSEQTAIFTLGYIHALDRLWSMDLLRRLSQGRLSEIFGNNTLELDIVMRNYGFQRHSELESKSLSNKTLEYLTFYTYGINEFVKSNTLPLEYSVMGIDFEEWKIEDTLAIMKMLMFHATYDWTIEALREYLYKSTKNTEIIDRMLPFLDKDLSVFNKKFLHDQIFKFDQDEVEISENDIPTNIKPIINDKRMKYQGTSSVWAIHGNHTRSGKPIFSVNTHFDLGVPSVMHPSELIYEDKFVVGFTIPGTPIYITGRNQNVTWSPSSVEFDISGAYKERIRNGTYLRDDEWIPLNIDYEIIKIKDGRNYTLEVASTDHGPLLKHIKNYSWEWLPNIDPGYPLFSNTSTSIVSAFIDIQYYQSIDKFIKDHQHINFGALSLILVDNLGKNGNIGYISFGDNIYQNFTSLHKIGYELGWEHSYHNKFQLSQIKTDRYIINPESGFICSTNNQ